MIRLTNTRDKLGNLATRLTDLSRHDLHPDNAKAISARISTELWTLRDDVAQLIEEMTEPDAELIAIEPDDAPPVVGKGA